MLRFSLKTLFCLNFDFWVVRQLNLNIIQSIKTIILILFQTKYQYKFYPFLFNIYAYLQRQKTYNLTTTKCFACNLRFYKNNKLCIIMLVYLKTCLLNKIYSIRNDFNLDLLILCQIRFRNCYTTVSTNSEWWILEVQQFNCFYNNM